jgi:hypothetical protein
MNRRTIPANNAPRKSVVSPARRSTSIKKKPLPFLGYLIAISALIVLALAEDKSPRPENSVDEGGMRFLSRNYWYEIALRRPKGEARHVAVVTIGADVPAGFAIVPTSKTPQNLSLVCQRRLYETALLHALSALHPKVIVADMWLDPKGCVDADVTNILLDEIAKVDVPLVFCLPTYDPAALIKGFPAEFAQARKKQPPLRSTELILMPIIHPPRSSTNSLSEGTVELNSDNQKIPLSWPVYDGFESVGQPDQPKRRDSLAVAAVRTFDSHNATLSRFGASSPNGSPKPSTELHPFTSLLPEEELPIYGAADVLCSHPIDSLRREDCRGTAVVGDLSERIVLIGLAGVGGDVHESSIGNVPGVVLQANYIEALLDGRVFKPVPIGWQIVAGILWLAIIFWIPLQYLSHPGGALLCSLLAGFLTAILMFW